MSSTSLKSPAKLNLHLNVLGSHPTQPGYHSLRSLMVKINLYDDLIIHIFEDSQRQYELIGLHLNKEEDLLYQSHQLFLQLSKLNFSIKIVIKKNIPHFAGLGGSSSNAATLLLHLNAYFKHPISPAALIRHSLHLGADIPFFMVEHQAAIVEGIGEEITMISPQAWTFLLIKSPEVIATGSAFSQLKSKRLTHSDRLSKLNLLEIWRSQSIGNYAQHFSNDFIHILPAYAQTHATLHTLNQEPAIQWASMSGSGNTLFACCETRQAAENYVQHYRSKGYFAHIVSTII